MDSVKNKISAFFQQKSKTSSERKKNVLWWGRFDPGYSRNRLVWSLFESLGWDNFSFRPLSSDFGYFESVARMLPRPDLIWVPCFRQRDALHACIRAKKWGVPVIFDPLISAYEKDVFERKKWPENHDRSLRLKDWERRLFRMADLVVADTFAHADFFCSSFGIGKRKIKVLFVGAEEDSFVSSDTTEKAKKKQIEILFYGSFLELHGVDVIVDAAIKTKDLDIKWVLLGDGPCKEALKHKASEIGNVSFEDPVPYKELPSRIAKAEILLGVLGSTVKAGLVIPNKIFQSMSMSKPVITRRATSYPEDVSGSDVIGWVDPGSADDLAKKVREWSEDPDSLIERGLRTREIYDRFFSRDILKEQLEGIIKAAFLNRYKGI